MGECFPTLDYQSKNLTEEQNAVLERWKSMEKEIRANTQEGELLRLALGIYDPGSNNLNNALAEWMIDRVKVDPREGSGQFPTMADLVKLDAEIYARKRQIKNMHKMSNPTSFRGFMQKMFYLPHEIARKFVGGDDVFNELNLATSRRDEMREKTVEHIKIIGDQLSKISGIGDDEYAGIARSRQQAAAAAKIKVDDLRERADRGEAVDMTSANAELAFANKQVADLKKDGRVGIHQKLQDDVIAAIEGDFGPPAKASKELAKRWGGTVKGRAVESVVQRTVKLLGEFETIAKHAMSAGELTMSRELQRLGMSKSEADAEAARAFEFNSEENYFPRQYVNVIGGLQELMRGLRTAANNDSYEAKTMLNDYHARKSNPTKNRTANDVARDLLRSDVTGVLSEYTEAILNMSYHNDIHEKVSRHVEHLTDIWAKNSKDPAMLDYIDGVSKFFMEYIDRATGTRDEGTGASLGRIMIGLKAAATMGIPNVSTPLLNFADGHLHPIIRMGIGGFRKAKSLSAVYGGEADEFVNRVFTSMTTEDLLGDSRRTSTKYLAQMFSPEEMKTYFGVEDEYKRRILTSIADKFGSVTDKALAAQRFVEKKNRRHAAKLAVLHELDFINTTFYDMFYGQNPRVPRSLIKKYSLEVEADGVPKDMDKAWELFKSERLHRAALDMIAGTQFLYNTTQRHWLEHQKVGGMKVGTMAMMYQHYPLNWVAAYRLFGEKLVDRLRATKDAGGLSIQEFMDRDVQYMASMGALHAVSAASRNASWIVGSSLFVHPAYEAIMALIDYYNGDDEERRRAFYGGAAPMVGLAPPLGALSSPFTDDAVNLLNVLIGREMYENGSLWDWANSPVSEAARIFTGLNPDAPDTYSDDGTKKHFKEGLMDTYLWDANRSIPKWMMLYRNWEAENFNATWGSVGRILGFRKNYDASDKKSRL